MTPSHTDRVRSLLADVEADRNEMLKLWASLFGAPGASMFPLDLMAFGAVKRNISTASAFRMLIESWNMGAAAHSHRHFTPFLGRLASQ